MPKATAANRNVQRYRDRMKRAGLRLVQLWVPDTRARGFAEECRRQSRVAARKRRVESTVMTWIEETRDTAGWTG
ncbi:MAG: antitoxin MazE family protein [Gemmatimonadaceae bacterium]|nr:antitoxin MazE family protein [Gemmatimonadaceae bacterium]